MRLPNPRLACSVIVGLLAPLAACSSVINAASAGGNNGDAGSGPLIPKSELGGHCAFGCEPDVACAIKDESCPDHYCVFDGRRGSVPAATCTAACDAATCPDGYTCEMAAHSSVKICIPKPGICGDGEIQGKEGCDDGNVLDFDACSKDCANGPTTVNMAIGFGADLSGYSKSQANESGPLPMAGDADGCGKVSIAETNGKLVFTLVVCDAKTKDRGRLLWTIPNKVGTALMTATDFQSFFGTIGSTAESAYEAANCSNCGLKVAVSSAWGTPAGFAATIESGLTKQGTTNGGYAARGTIAVIPGPPVM